MGGADVEGGNDLPRGRGQRVWREYTILQLAKVRKVWKGSGHSGFGCGERLCQLYSAHALHSARPEKPQMTCSQLTILLFVHPHLLQGDNFICLGIPGPI